MKAEFYTLIYRTNRKVSKDYDIKIRDIENAKAEMVFSVEINDIPDDMSSGELFSLLAEKAPANTFCVLDNHLKIKILQNQEYDFPTNIERVAFYKACPDINAEIPKHILQDVPLEEYIKNLAKQTYS